MDKTGIEYNDGMATYHNCTSDYKQVKQVEQVLKVIEFYTGFTSIYFAYTLEEAIQYHFVNMDVMDVIVDDNHYVIRYIENGYPCSINYTIQDIVPGHYATI